MKQTWFTLVVLALMLGCVFARAAKTPEPMEGVEELKAPEPEGYSKWTLTVSGLTVRKSPWTSLFGTGTPDGGVQEFNGMKAAMGFRLLPLMGVSAFAGTFKDNPGGGNLALLLGGDVDLYFLSLGWGDIPFLETALVIGVSNFTSNSNIVPHLGLKGTFNFIPRWGFTGAIRANEYSALGEVGIVVRL